MLPRQPQRVFGGSAEVSAREKIRKPKTPYQRILESPDIPKETKDQLKDQFETLNPFELRKTMEEKLKRLFPQ